MSIKVHEFYMNFKETKQSFVRMNEKISFHNKGSLVSGMIAKVIEVNNECYSHIDLEDALFEIVLDINSHERYNRFDKKATLLNDYLDYKNENFGIRLFPNDGILKIYICGNKELPFSIVNEKSLFFKYLEDFVSLEKDGMKLSYVEWLEQLVLLSEDKL